MAYGIKRVGKCTNDWLWLALNWWKEAMLMTVLACLQNYSKKYSTFIDN